MDASCREDELVEKYICGVENAVTRIYLMDDRGRR